MTDLVERLRQSPCDVGGDHPDLHEEAADEIERLRAENDAWQNQDLLEQSNRQADEIERLRGDLEVMRLQRDATQSSRCSNCERLHDSCAELRDVITKKCKRIEKLEDKLHHIKQWCNAYPRTVFIEPTKKQWAEANKVLEAHKPDCPSLTAISGSNMRHVVEGIAKIAALKGVESDG